MEELDELFTENPIRGILRLFQGSKEGLEEVLMLLIGLVCSLAGLH